MSGPAIAGLGAGIAVAQRLDGRAFDWNACVDLADRHRVDVFDVIAEVQRLVPPPPQPERRGRPRKRYAP